MVKHEHEFDLIDWIECIFMQWKWIVCTVLIAAVSAGAVSIFFVSPVFKATATLHALDTSTVGLNYADVQLGYALAKEYQQALDMEDVHEGVIRSLSLPYTCEELREMQSAAVVKGTCMIEISVKAKTPEEAAQIANAYAQVGGDYIEQTLGLSRPQLISRARVPEEREGPGVLLFCLGGAAVGLVLACIILAVRMRMKEHRQRKENKIKVCA